MKEIEFDYNETTVLEMKYLLSNFAGPLDADKQKLVLDL
jgi:hypothetical protein